MYIHKLVHYTLYKLITNLIYPVIFKTQVVLFLHLNIIYLFVRVNNLNNIKF